jgi:hypothetical protein
MQSITSKPSAPFKATLDTKYNIDYAWWERSDEDLGPYLLSQLAPEQRERLNTADDKLVDYIDPDTAEVFEVDALGLEIRIAAHDPNFITPQVALVDCIFRVFLANNNTPLSPRELEGLTGRPAATILSTVSGKQVWKGIRPFQG